MTDNGYYPDLDHLSSGHPEGKETLQTKSFQYPSGQEEDPTKGVESEFKDYFCPFCGYKLFRGKVRDYKMLCHQCNRLVDSKKLEKNDLEGD